MGKSGYGNIINEISLQQKLDHQLLIHDFVKEVLEQNTVNDILWTICKNVISKLGLEDCVIYLVDEQHGTLVQKAAYGPKNPVAQEILSEIIVPLGEGVVGTVGKTGIAEIVNDTSKDNRYIIDDAIRLSEIAVPIINKGKVIGVIDSENSAKDFYTDYHLQMLETIASLCSTRISYSLLNDEVHVYKNELEVIVEERTKELKKTIQKLQISNDNLERYAYVVSHDLKSPLNTISAFVGLIDQGEENLKPKSREFVSIIKQTTERMSTLLSELLEVSLEGKDNDLASCLKLNSILDTVLKNLEFEMSERDVAVEIANDLPQVNGLESHFIQLFQNILSNSIKYSLPEEKLKIAISSDSTDTGNRISIRDNGIGIEKQFEESIFNLGERNIEDDNGKGIGLHTCKRIVEHYKGKIKATSHGLNKGLTINIELPFKA